MTEVSTYLSDRQIQAAAAFLSRLDVGSQGGQAK